MELMLFAARKKSWSEINAEDQRRLGNEANAAFWDGRALAYQDILEAARSGVVMTDGTIAPLENTWATHQDAADGQ